MTARRATAAICGLALSSACGVSFPDEWLIEDLRILNVIAEPPEIPIFAPAEDGRLTFDPETLPELALTPVRFTALVAHPDLNAAFEHRWVRCGPGFSRLPCEEGQTFDITTNTSSAVDISPVGVLFEDISGGADLVELGQALAEDPRDLFGGFYARINVSVSVRAAQRRVDTTELLATKRLVLYDSRIIASALEQASTEEVPEALADLNLPSLCAGVSEARRDALLAYLRVRQPNRSPVLESIEAEVLTSGTRTATVSLMPGQLLEISAGSSIGLRSRWRPGSAERYRVIDGNCELRTFDELLVTSWFASRGALSRQLTTAEEPFVRYTAPPPQELAEDGTLVRVWAVLRDGRGGSQHQSFDLLIRR